MSSDRPYYPPPPPPPPPTPTPTPSQQGQPAGSPVPPQAPMGMPPGTSYPQAPQYAQQYVQQYVQPAATKPSAFWVLTVISFLCSFLVGGVAMFFSYQVGERWKAGNVAGARKASQLALWIGLAGIVIGIIFIAALNSAGDSSGY